MTLFNTVDILNPHANIIVFGLIEEEGTFFKFKNTNVDYINKHKFAFKNLKVAEIDFVDNDNIKIYADWID